MNKFLLTAVGVAILCLFAFTSPNANAQVYGEFKTIKILNDLPYTEINGTVVNSTDFALPPNYIGNDRNDGYYRVNLPFSFEFNGDLFNQLWISINGFVTLSPPPAIPANYPDALFLDGNNYPINVIAPYWGDHFYRDLTDFYQQGFVPSEISYADTVELDANGISHRVFIVQWKNLNINYLENGVPVKSSVGNFQVRLHESTDQFSRQGNIEFAYGTIGPKDRPDITDNRVITKGAVVGIKGEGKIIGYGSDYLNALFPDDMVLASTSEEKTTFWQPSGGSDKRIFLTASVSFNDAEWWGDGDVDFSKSFGRKHYGMPQNRFVTANDFRLIIRSIVEEKPLDPVRRRAAYHGDVNHNGRYYYDANGKKVHISTKSKVYTDDLPSEISSVKQVLFEANEWDAAIILSYTSGRVPELPWLVDSIIQYGKLTGDVVADGIKIGKLTKVENDVYMFPVFVNNTLNGKLGTKFNVNGEILDIIQNDINGNDLIINNNTNLVVAVGNGKFTSNEPLFFVKVRINENSINLTNVRFNDNEIADLNAFLSVNTNDLTTNEISNSPNPVVDYTTINVNVQNSGFYNLNIYDATGNLVKSLSSKEFKSGISNTLNWNRTDNANQKVSNGAYFLRLEGNGLNIVKMVIVGNN